MSGIDRYLDEAERRLAKLLSWTEDDLDQDGLRTFAEELLFEALEEACHGNFTGAREIADATLNQVAKEAIPLMRERLNHDLAEAKVLGIALPRELADALVFAKQKGLRPSVVAGKLSFAVARLNREIRTARELNRATTFEQICRGVVVRRNGKGIPVALVAA